MFFIPRIGQEIINDLSNYLDRHNISNIKDIVGKIEKTSNGNFANQRFGRYYFYLSVFF